MPTLFDIIISTITPNFENGVLRIYVYAYFFPEKNINLVCLHQNDDSLDIKLLSLSVAQQEKIEQCLEIMNKTSHSIWNKSKILIIPDHQYSFEFKFDSILNKTKLNHFSDLTSGKTLNMALHEVFSWDL